MAIKYWAIIDSDGKEINRAGSTASGLADGSSRSDWVEVTENYDTEGKYYDGSAWVDVMVSVDQLRVERDKLLLESDHVVTRHRDQMGHTATTTNSLTDTKYQEWLKYRQDLRDLPSGYTAVASPTYPTKP